MKRLAIIGLFLVFGNAMLSQAQCKTYTCFLCEWSGEFTIVAPNIFTPNDDYVNDSWTPVISNRFCLADYKVTFYTRWGEQIFESYVPEVGWNGKAALTGNLYEEGTYFYLMTYSNGNTKIKYTQKGVVQLSR